MNIEQLATQVLENIISDLMYAYELDRELAERISFTVIKNPQLAVELETVVRNKRALGL
jgi:hypothetical protein